MSYVCLFSILFPKYDLKTILVGLLPHFFHQYCLGHCSANKIGQCKLLTNVNIIYDCTRGREFPFFFFWMKKDIFKIYGGREFWFDGRKTQFLANTTKNQ